MKKSHQAVKNLRVELRLVVLFVISSLYHGIHHVKAKRILNILDHCGIFLLIAGTYTPVVLISIGGTIGWVIFGIQWGMATIGIILKLFYTGRYDLLSTFIYAFMGWAVVLKINLLRSLLEDTAYWLLIAGGVSYTLGIIFYLIDTRMKYAHFIWHLFVIGGSVSHFLMISLYIYR